MPNKFIPPTTDTATRTAATPIDGEVLYDTDEKKLYYGDGTTTGGKAIGSPTVTDNVFRIQDNSDNTKQLAFETSGITTGTTRTLTVPDSNGTVLSTDTLTDKALYYYDASTKLFKPVGIGTLGQTLIAQPNSNSPYQWGTPTGGGRQILSANKNLYVNIATGSDSNDGSSDSPFATIQKAVNVISGTLDGYGYEGFIHIKGGTYSEVITLKSLIGFTNVTIQAWEGTGTVTLQNQHLFSGFYVGQYTLKNLVLNAGSGKNAVDIAGGTLVIDGCTFGAGNVHLFCSGGTARIRLKSYTINGGAYAHYYSFMKGVVERFNSGVPATCTVTGTPAFTFFAFADRGGIIDMNPASSSFVFFW